MIAPKYASTPSEIMPRETVLTMSGLDYLQGIIAGRIALPPIAQTFNYRFTHAEAGKVICRGTPEFAAFNLHGTPHGGWYATVLDSCLACAFQSTLPAGSSYTTLELKINITRSIPKDTEIEAVGICQHSGRMTGVASAEMRGVEDGKLYATASTTCIVLKA